MTSKYPKEPAGSARPTTVASGGGNAAASGVFQLSQNSRMPATPCPLH